VVADVTKKVSRVVTRGFTKWFFLPKFHMVWASTSP
jgi:hypothetical protein